MQKRRSHKKSRNGCQNCKKWHVKCDEEGPPCNNCRLREAKCVYAVPRSARNKSVSSTTSSSGHLAPPTVDPQLSDSSADERASSVGLGESATSEALSNTSGEAEYRRLLELELMHRWTTHTYLGAISIPEDVVWNQIYMPRQALETNLGALEAIFACAALDLALASEEPDRSRYLFVGIEYYERFVPLFRASLEHITPETMHCALFSSYHVVIANLAIAQCAPTGSEEHGQVRRMRTIFEMLRGSTAIILAQPLWAIKASPPIQAVIKMGLANPDDLDAGETEAIARLFSINARIYGCLDDVAEHTAQFDDPLTPHKCHRHHIVQLQQCYAQDKRGWVKGYCIGFPGMAGEEFATAIDNEVPMAYLLMLHWAVLLQRLNEAAWWAGHDGRRLAFELADNLSHSPYALELEFQESVGWALSQVGPPA